MSENLDNVHVCSKDKLHRDVDGALLNYDEEYYGSGDLHDVITAVQEYFFNRSNAVSLSNVSEKANQSYRVTLHEFLSTMDPRQDLELYNHIMLENFIIVSAYLLIILVSLFGNLLVLFIILSRRNLRAQTTNKLIANLTFSDLLLTVFNIPLTVVRLLFDSWPLGSMFCHLGPLVQAVSVYVSTISMVFIALDRLEVLVLGSLPKRLSSTLSSIWTIVFIWVLASLFSLPHFVFNRVVHRQTYTCVKRCQAVYPKPAVSYSRAVTIFTFLSQYIIPLTIIIICYTHIGIHIWKRVRIGAMTRSQKYSHLQARKRTIKMLVLVCLVFAITWLPLNLYHFYLDFVPGTEYSKTMFTFCHWFGISSVCANPFIYFWLNKQYKERARSILRVCFKCCQADCRSDSIDCDIETCSSYENVPNVRNSKHRQVFSLRDITRGKSHPPKRSSYSDTFDK